MYRVHLSTGHFLTINAGFVHIIEENNSGFFISDKEREGNVFDSQDLEQYEHLLSCEDPNSTSTEDGNSWLLELLYRERYIQSNIVEEEEEVYVESQNRTVGGREEAFEGGHTGGEGDETGTTTVEESIATALLYA